MSIIQMNHSKPLPRYKINEIPNLPSPSEFKEKTVLLGIKRTYLQSREVIIRK